MKQLALYFFHPGLLRKEFAPYWMLLAGLILDIYPAVKLGYYAILTWPAREMLVAAAMIYTRHHTGRFVFKKIPSPQIAVGQGMWIFACLIFLSTLGRAVTALFN